MKRLLFSLLMIAFFASSCMVKNGKGCSLFLSKEMNEAFKEFLDSSKMNPRFIQVVIGRNQQGVKVSLFETKTRLDDCLYWFDPQKAKYLGQFILGQDSITVFAFSDDDLADVINKSVLIKSKPRATSMADNIRIRARYYQLTSGSLRPITIREGRFVSRRYKYVNTNADDINYELLISDEPCYYEMILTDAVVWGQWGMEDDSTIMLNPLKLYGYSPARNEFIELPMFNHGIKDGYVGECLDVLRYSIRRDTLLPISAPNAIDRFYWISDKR